MERVERTGDREGGRKGGRPGGMECREAWGIKAGRETGREGPERSRVTS